MTRRDALAAAALPLLGLGGSLNASSLEVRRRYHVCLTSDAIEPDPDLLGLVDQSGVSDFGLWDFFTAIGITRQSADRFPAAVEG